MVEGKEIFSIQNQKNPRKIEKRKSKKNRKRKTQKKEKEKNSSFPVVLDKTCIFCLYPIPDLSAIRKEGQL